MGQKMNPNGLRVGIIKDWSSKWYADSKHFADYLVEDHKIREYVKKKLYASGISKVEIERTAKFVKVNVYTAKPGLVIGKGGNLAESLKAELQKMIGKDFVGEERAQRFQIALDAARRNAEFLRQKRLFQQPPIQESGIDRKQPCRFEFAEFFHLSSFLCA